MKIKSAIIILFVYWVVCALAITFIYAFDAGKIPERFKYARLFAPLLVQFTFGGLLSNSFIFYWFSGSIWVSWPFILAFVGLMVSNDALRHHFVKPTVQLSVYFFATFSIFSVSLPFIFNSLNPWLFVASGVFALVFIAGFIWFLKNLAGAEKFKRGNLTVSIITIFALANLFYFFNLIPPVPLAVRETGLYHSVLRMGGKYVLKGEPESLWQKLIPGKKIHLLLGQRAYVFSAIYAPKELNTQVVHEWQYYSQAKGGWEVKDELAFTLVGGRQEGFRGYSYKTNLPLGKWRVYIKTRRGQTLGRIKFEIIRAQGEVLLEEAEK